MNIDDTLLQRLVPMNALPRTLRAHLRQSARVLEPAPGERLFQEGDRDDAVYYLLRGGVELTAEGGRRDMIEAGGEAARHPLSPELPRRHGAATVGRTEILQVNRTLLDTCLFWTQATGNKDDRPAAEPNEWLTRLAASALFSRIPPENIQKVLTLLEPVPYMAGDAVVRQGEAGDYYYIIQKGRCAVSRRMAGSPRELRLAELGPGECFGEEALITASRRNATVSMMTDGVLRRLTKQQFTDLIKKPVTRELDVAETRRLATEPGVKWLDVRLPEEYAKTAIKGSLNIPLAQLRDGMAELDRNSRYIVYCDSGSRSAVATFLMMERGFEAYHLDGGIMNRKEPVGASTVGQVLNAARQARQRRLELARANRSVAVATHRSAEAAGIDQAAETTLERLGDRPDAVANQGLEAALQSDQLRFKDDARTTERALEEAQRRRLELAADTAILERLSDEEISLAEQKEQEVRAASEKRLRAGEARLERLYQRVCEQLEQTRQAREQFEQVSTDTRRGLEDAVREAEARLAEIEEQLALAATALNEARTSLVGHDNEVAGRRKALMASELEVRERTRLELNNERQRLETEFAEVAAEIEGMRREREEAEAARRLAAEEAERVETPPEPSADVSRGGDGHGLAAARSRLERETAALEDRLENARQSHAAAKDELETLLADAGDSDAVSTLDEAIRAQRQRVARAGEHVITVETAQERLRITRDILDAGSTRSEAIEDTLTRRLAMELEEWVNKESQNEQRNEEVENQLYNDLLQAQKEAFEAQKAEEEATAHMMDEIRAQLESPH